ncbi:malectin domain-containing carbohydrate-binding protein [Xanthocytophaga agilis]|uniref:Malectin domain-containing carbohydrate-binding protein n=1 Tax=Xanthocytophaga agilis TaxID=3048010 RepID=A0AAE3RBB2_9BACT|nr:malectin domain-containing carbohydrate-binding protein [Xanthocytophaga agilis]MDJ1505030.1 malectin domain-containing carbohydrate-binding protein [Xanthocytophaga agilis]
MQTLTPFPKRFFHLFDFTNLPAKCWLWMVAFLLTLSCLAQPTPEQISKIVASNGSTMDFFGYRMALYGNTLVFGTLGRYNEYGAAYIFTFTNGSWQQTAKLTSTDQQAGDFFGDAVATNGATIVIGAKNHTINGSIYQGAAYVFSLVNGVWQQSAKLTSTDSDMLDNFGSAVTMSDSTLMIGAPQAAGNGRYEHGAVYVFTQDNGSWLQTAKITIDPQEAEEYNQNYGMYFGRVIAIDGNRCVIGKIGAVYVFTFMNGNWQQTGKLISDGESDVFGYFGYFTDISGNNIIVSEHVATVNGHEYQGAVYLFMLENGIWQQKNKFTDNTVQNFGNSVAIDGNTGIATIVGAAYIFNLSNNTWRQTAILRGSPYDGFGSSTIIEDSVLVIGAAGTEVNGNPGQGVAYWYKVKNFTLDAPDPLSVTLSQTLTKADTAVLHLSWQDPGDETGYILESVVGTFDNGNEVTRDTLPADLTHTTFRAARLLDSSLRSFRLYAFTTQGISSYTSSVSVQVPPPIPFRLNAGARKIVHSGGYTFAPDQFFSEYSDRRYFQKAEIAGTVNDLVYQAFRSGEMFNYNIPVINGQYIVTLNFAELYFSSPGQRVFSVNIEGGVSELVNFDVFVAAGGANKALARHFPITVTDGFLTVEFTSQISKAMIAAIQLTSISSARTNTQTLLSKRTEISNLPIYPNPVRDWLTIPINPESEQVTVKVINQLGMNVYEQLYQPADKTILLSLGHLPAGPYVILLQDKTGTMHATPVIKQ